MNPCVKTEGKCNESVNNKFQKQFITSNNKSEQTNSPYSCLFNYFLIHLF